MKRTFLLISAVLLSVMAAVQTATAQKVKLYMADNQTFECDIEKLDSIVFYDAPTIVETEEIVVTVDANGNADGGHQFTKIDNSTFIIDGIKYIVKDGYLEVSGYDSSTFTGVASIISKLKYNGQTFNVVSIGDEAFRDCYILASITIPGSVTSIGSYAFNECSISSITIGSGVTSIGDRAFSGCPNLSSITVETGNPTYDSRDNSNAIIETATNALIVGCKNTTIPSSVTSIGDWAFSCSYDLTSITIPNSVTSIGDYAFYCTRLTSITIPNSVTSIGAKAFSYCYDLTSITIPESVTSIRDRAFQHCENLASITISEGVTSIGDRAFGGCSGLTSITIPESVTSIGDEAFTGCSGLTSINIPGSVTTINGWVFSYCSGLTSVTIPGSVTSIADGAFYSCSSLTHVYCYAENVPSTKSSAFYYSPISSATLHVPAGSMDAYKAAEPWNGFGSIVAMEQVEPEGGIVVTVDADGNADGGHQFTKINDSTFIIDGIKYKVKDGNLEVSGYDDATFTGVALIISKLKYNGQTFNVVRIGDQAFSWCDALTSITIPESVTSIGGGAFICCDGLTSVTIPNSVTSIGNDAFSGCYSLTSITIPESVTSIGGYAFDGCDGLTSVTIPNSVTSIGESAFNDCSGLTSITIGSGVTSIGGHAFYECSGLTSIMVQTDNPAYDSRDNCNAVIETATNTLIVGCKNTVIPNSVTSIGTDAFYNCFGLTSITIPNSVTSIGTDAFDGCYYLTSVTIGSGVTSIGSSAFFDCSGLTNVYCYADNVPETSLDAFEYSPVSSATLHVPAGSVDAYKAAEPWSKFGSIVAIE